MRRLFLITLILFGCAHQPPKPPPHIDQSFVGDVAGDHNRDVLSCYQKLLPENAALEGELVLNFRVRPDGEIESPQVQQVLDPALDQCVLGKAAKWNFPWHKQRHSQETLYLTDSFTLKKDGEGVARVTYKEDTSLDPEEVHKVIQDHTTDVRMCYRKSPNAKLHLNGKLSLSWTIDSEGQSVAILNKKSLAKEIDECIIAALKTWKFPLPPAGQLANVSYSFVFAGQ